MTPPAATRPNAAASTLWPLLPTMAVTWLAFGQVLSLSGLAIWVIASSLAAAWLCHTLLANARPFLALAAAGAMTAAAPALARTLGGDSAGPITRSSLMATGVAAAMAFIVSTRYRAALVAASLILLGGATGLGAAGRAPWLVGLWTVAAAGTLLMLGPYARADLRDRRRLVPTAVVLAVVGLVAVAGIGAATPVLRTPWTIPGAASINDPVIEDGVNQPPDSSDTTDAATPTPDASTGTTPDTAPTATATGTDTEENSPDPVDRDTQDATVAFVAAVLLLLLGLLVLLLFPLARRGIIAWRWHRERARLRRGSPHLRIVGAWTWVRLCRARYGGALPVAASPDVAVGIADRERDQALRDLADLVTVAAYDPRAQESQETADRAWSDALVAGSRPGGATLRERWRWSRVGPGAARRALQAPAAHLVADQVGADR